MIRSSLIVAAVIASGLGAFSALAASETTFLPGYYETVTRVAGDPEAETQRDCVTAAEARTRTLERALAEMVEGRCTYSKRQIGGGRFEVAGSCIDDGVRSTFRYTGVYTPTSFNITLNSRTVLSGQNLDVRLTSVSRRLAAVCPR